jgi:hypothetical protein
MIKIITKEMARRFLLSKHGLIGKKRFSGKDGIMNWIDEAGCIQYDPIDVCGKNHELVLQSRVDGFKRGMVEELLYKERKLLDGWDKNMSIYRIDDYPYFERKRIEARGWQRSKNMIESVRGEVMGQIHLKGPVCSKDLDINKKVDWYWASTSLSRAALERLYHEGELIVHHKENTRKFYDLIWKHIPDDILNLIDPNPLEEDYYQWYLLRRIRSVGMMWNRSSDAFLGIDGFKADKRKQAFKQLLEEGLLTEINVKGVQWPFFIASEDIKYFDSDDQGENRMEFIAPLDNLIWDRKLIEVLFDFNYKWEIYTPAIERKYGYYVIPILYDHRFIGRIELIKNRSLNIYEPKSIWWEEKEFQCEEVLTETLNRFNLAMNS